MSLVESGDPIGAEVPGKGDQRCIYDAQSQAGMDAEHLQRLSEGARPPAELVGASAKVSHDLLRNRPAASALEDVVDLGQSERRGHELIALPRDPVPDLIVIGLVGNGQSHHNRGVEDYRHSPKPVSAR